jgi:hypothetical protein
MKTSSTDIAWEEKPEDITAQILAQRVKKETRLREIAEQSAWNFLLGDFLFSSILRCVGLIAIGVLYFRTEVSASLGAWPIFTLGAFIEAYRANRRLDAMIELGRITTENNQANKP